MPNNSTTGNRRGGSESSPHKSRSGPGKNWPDSRHQGTQVTNNKKGWLSKFKTYASSCFSSRGGVSPTASVITPPGKPAPTKSTINKSITTDKTPAKSSVANDVENKTTRSVEALTPFQSPNKLYSTSIETETSTSTNTKLMSAAATAGILDKNTNKTTDTQSTTTVRKTVDPTIIPTPHMKDPAIINRLESNDTRTLMNSAAIGSSSTTKSTTAPLFAENQSSTKSYVADFNKSKNKSSTVSKAPASDVSKFSGKPGFNTKETAAKETVKDPLKETGKLISPPKYSIHKCAASGNAATNTKFTLGNAATTDSLKLPPNTTKTVSNTKTKSASTDAAKSDSSFKAPVTDKSSVNKPKYTPGALPIRINSSKTAIFNNPPDIPANIVKTIADSVPIDISKVKSGTDISANIDSNKVAVTVPTNIPAPIAIKETPVTEKTDVRSDDSFSTLVSVTTTDTTATIGLVTTKSSTEINTAIDINNDLSKFLAARVTDLSKSDIGFNALTDPAAAAKSASVATIRTVTTKSCVGLAVLSDSIGVSPFNGSPPASVIATVPIADPIKPVNKPSPLETSATTATDKNKYIPIKSFSRSNIPAGVGTAGTVNIDGAQSPERMTAISTTNINAAPIADKAISLLAAPADTAKKSSTKITENVVNSVATAVDNAVNATMSTTGLGSQYKLTVDSAP